MASITDQCSLLHGKARKHYGRSAAAAIALLLAAGTVEAQTALVDVGGGCTGGDCPHAPSGTASSGPAHGEITVNWTPATTGRTTLDRWRPRIREAGGTFADKAFITWDVLTYTFSGLDVSKTYDVQIVGQAGSTRGNAAQASGVSPLTDTTPPTVNSASVNGKTLTVTFGEALDEGSTPAGSAFSVSATPQGGTARTIAGTLTASLSGMTATVTLASAVVGGETVTVSYTTPTNNPLRDLSTNNVANFTQAATNNTPADTTSPTFSSASVDGKALTVTFDEALDQGSAPAGSAFSVSATPQGGTARTIRGTGTASLSGMTATVTLASAVVGGETVTVSYTTPTNNPLRDLSANNVANFSGEETSNDSPPSDTTPPTFSSASVNGKTLTVTFDEALDSDSAPAGNAFSVRARPQGGAARRIDGTGTASLSGTTATVTLASAVDHGDAVTVSYSKPTNNPLRDSTGNEVATFTGKAVTNATPGPAAPGPARPGAPPPPPPTDNTAPGADSTPSVRGATIVIFFDELLRAGGVPPAEAFEVVAGGGETEHPTAVDVAGRVVTLTLAAPVDGGATVEVRYTRPQRAEERLQDSAGNAVADFVRTATSESPEGRPTADAGADLEVDPRAAVALDGSASADPDGQDLAWSWSQVLGDEVTLAGARTATPSFTAPESPGVLVFRLTVTDAGGLTAFDEVTVAVRDFAPSFGTARIAALSLVRGRALAPVVLPEASGGNGALSYGLASEPAGLAGLSFDPATRTLSGTPEGAGRWEFALWAEDADDNRADADAAVLTFGVTVESARAADARKSAVTRTLAALGRRTLSGALDAIDGRFADAGPGNSVTLAGHSLPLGGSGAAALVGTAGACGPEYRHDHRGVGAATDGCAVGGAHSRSMSVQEFLRSSAFSWRLSGASTTALDTGEAEAEAQPPPAPEPGEVVWSAWGTGDFGTFTGRPEPGTSYDGESLTGWLGFDAGGGPWVAGLAVSHGTVKADYGFDGGDDAAERGRLETTLTALYPYVRLILPADVELRAVLGAGRGEARHVAGGQARETSDLTMWMASLGLGRALPSLLGVDLAVRADAGFVRMETGEGPDHVDGLSADGWRVRTGLEAARRFTLDEAMALTPFVEAVGRYDWGDGVDEFGLEVAGGLRYTAPRVRLEARGRLLAAHTVEGVSERGVSITAQVASAEHGRGLSLSLSPSWGAGEGTGAALWRDERPTAARVSGDGGAVDARVGYGLGVARYGVLTPFAETRLAGEDASLRLGARFEASGTDLGVELAGERRQSGAGGAEHRVEFMGTVRW